MARESCTDDKPFDAATDEGRCRCKGATLRAYNGMKDSGAAECEAVEAAWRVYSFHHPKDAPYDSRLTVERWIYADRAH
jgi:hypothetical protein